MSSLATTKGLLSAGVLRVAALVLLGAVRVAELPPEGAVSRCSRVDLHEIAEQGLVNPLRVSDSKDVSAYDVWSVDEGFLGTVGGLLAGRLEPEKQAGGSQELGRLFGRVCYSLVREGVETQDPLPTLPVPWTLFDNLAECVREIVGRQRVVVLSQLQK